jgi:hypothetical protein
MPITARKSLFIVPILLGLQGLAACDKSCEKLKAHVCDDARYRKQNPKHCELFEDEARLALYTPKACRSVLDHIHVR